MILNKFSEMNKTPVLPVKTGLWPQPPFSSTLGSPGRYACATSFPLRSSHASSHYCHFIHPNLFRTNNKNNSSIHCVSNIYNSNPHKEDLLVVFLAFLRPYQFTYNTFQYTRFRSAKDQSVEVFLVVSDGHAVS